MSSKSILSVHCEELERIEEAQELAKDLKLPFGVKTLVELWVLRDKLALKQEGCGFVSVDFNQPPLKSALIRACKPAKGRVIWDITAGLGRDAAVLWSKGASLTLVERDPVVYMLLQDGLRRAHLEGQVNCYLGEAKTYLEPLKAEHYPDVIYIDPMHPIRSKSAKVKKEMQCLQQWIVPDDPMRLLLCALNYTKERVVMKWPVRKPPLLKPNHSLIGKTVRFDVYLTD